MCKTCRMQYWPGLAVLAALTLAASMPASQLELSVGRTAAPAGEVVKIPINAEAKVAAGAMQLDLLYDPNVLTFKAVENGPLLTSALVESNVSAPGRLRIALASNEEVKGKGVLLNIEFEVQSGDPRTVGLQLEKAHSWDQANNLEMTVDARGAEFVRSAPAIPPLPLWVWVAVGGTLVALILGLLMVLGKKRKSPESVGAESR